MTQREQRAPGAAMPVRRSILANAFSITIARAWQALLQLVCTPIYIALLGPSAYGLVAFNATLVSVLLFLDQFVTPTVVRELGRFDGEAGKAADMRNLMRGLEVVSWATAILVGGGIMLVAPILARHWFTSSAIDAGGIESAVRIMALSVAFQWPSFLYGGAFIGLRRQDLYSVLRVSIATLQALGSIALMWLVSADVILFLGWQAAMFLLQSFLCRETVWRLLPHSDEPTRFDPARLRTIWRFAAGTMGVSLTAALLNYGDKLIVSRLTDLDSFTAYSIAFFLVSNIYFLAISPVWSSLQPLFARLIARGEEEALKREYHGWTQTIAVIVLPAMAPLIVYARPVMQIWLGPSSPLVEPAASYVPFFAAAFIFNGFTQIAWLLQLASGWVRLNLARNVVAVVLFLPAIYAAISLYGPWVGSVGFAILQAAFFATLVPLMHRRLLPTEMRAWYLRDTIGPMLLTCAILALSAALPAAGRWLSLVFALATSAVIAAALIAVLPHARAKARGLYRRIASRIPGLPAKSA